MRSKTSCFNKTVFKKNLTRFAPVWVIYTICLLTGLFLVYTDRGYSQSALREFWFIRDMTELVNVMAVVNLGYGLLVAELLFGDLFNSRMANMLHALPLRRETWFVTNCLSGLVFSLVPTAVMALVSLPLLTGTFFENAWQIAPLLFLASNLQYLCFFGLAVFAAMCVGNRFTMAAGYGLLNAGAYIAYFLIDTVYTPLLYGIITPMVLATTLTPAYHMTNASFMKIESNISQLREIFGEELEGATTAIQVTGDWWRLWVWAAVGLGFLVLALVLYRKRDIECAGDAVAFRPLVPVFQVLCALFVSCAAQFFLYSFLGLRDQNYVVLVLGLVIGWFVGKMLLERSTRVFRLRNWYGLFALSGVLALSLVLTYFDVLNIEERMPDADRVKEVVFSSNNSNSLEEEADIQQVLQFHQLALEDRAENSGNYVLGTNGEWVPYSDTYSAVIDEEQEDPDCRYVAEVMLNYRLTNGNTVRRRYNVPVDSPAGVLAEEILNRWEFVDSSYMYAQVEGREERTSTLDLVLNDFQGFSIDYHEDDQIPAELKTREAAESFLAAVKADCEERNMAQHAYFHTGVFRIEDADYEKGYRDRCSLWINLQGKKYGWDIMVFPDSENTLRWLTEHGLLENIDIRPNITGLR